ncbi:MAG: hypothetical protein ACOCQC_01840 [Halanaerobiaceae bacterium]
MTENTGDTNPVEKESVNIEYILFLILILLIMSNQGNFSKYFKLINREVNKVETILQAFSATAENLQGTFIKPQEILHN